MMRTFLRALGLLRTEGSLAFALVTASVAIGLVQLAEPILFGMVVDALAQRQPAFTLVGGWALLGLFGIAAGVVVAVFADRYCHRLRLLAMSQAFERALTLPIGYREREGTAPIIRGILVGGDTLFGIWLAFLREHVTAIVSIVLLVPTAISLDWRMALLLGALALVYAVLNAFVIRQTSEKQSQVERYHQSVFGRMGDVVGNITVVQSYTRLAAETVAVRGLMNELLAAQYPVLTWWGVLAVLNRAAGTITMVGVFLLGSVLVSRGELSVGEIVSFVGFAGLLIGKLDQLSGFVGRIFMQAPALRTYFGLVDASVRIADAPGARPLRDVKGDVVFDRVSYSFDDGKPALKRISFRAEAGETIGIIGPTGAGKTTMLALLQRLREGHRRQPSHGAGARAAL
ncbi:MAG: ABC transporter transmembrane domain-containing protein, partial [Hyphomicrobiales bacterium]